MDLCEIIENISKLNMKESYHEKIYGTECKLYFDLELHRDVNGNLHKIDINKIINIVYD